MFLILLSSCFYFSAKPEGEGKSTCWPFVCLALSHSDLIMALTFSLLFTYHVNRWCQSEASLFLLFPSQRRLFIYWSQCHLCFIHVRPHACSRLSLFFPPPGSIFNRLILYMIRLLEAVTVFERCEDTNGTKSGEEKKKKVIYTSCLFVRSHDTAVNLVGCPDKNLWAQLSSPVIWMSSKEGYRGFIFQLRCLTKIC